MLSEIQKHPDLLMHERNNRVLVEFEGYSQTGMHQILFSSFGGNSPFRLSGPRCGVLRYDS